MQVQQGEQEFFVVSPEAAGRVWYPRHPREGAGYPTKARAELAHIALRKGAERRGQFARPRLVAINKQVR